MAIVSLFPTRLYKARIAATEARRLNRDLAPACHALERDDKAGLRWCKDNGYPGYTSYASLDDLAWRSPAFAELQKLIQPHLTAFGRELQFDTARKAWRIDSLWVNILHSEQMVAARTSAMSSAALETTSRGGVPVYVATPSRLDPKLADRIYLDIHGGALVFGGGESCKLMAGMSAARYGAKFCAVDYRMPPDHPYPAALDDCLAVYKSLASSHGARNIIVGGSSAGGNLAAATVLRARDEGLPLPAGVVLFTPMSDLTESGDSFETLRDLDVVLRRRLFECGALYADGKDLKTPYISPNFGDYTKGFPPTLLQTGTRDLFLSNTVLLHRAMRKAGVEAELHVWEAMPHGGFGGASPEDTDMTQEVRRFIAKCWR